jgi:serine/threonine protein phosphatase PrpC
MFISSNIATTNAPRAVLCRNGKAVFETIDHKPDHPAETKRIVEAGGFVAAKRVCRCLAVSRAFGDHYFKSKDQPAHQRMVSCVPVCFASFPVFPAFHLRLFALHSFVLECVHCSDDRT